MEAVYRLTATEEWQAFSDPDWEQATRLIFTPERLIVEDYSQKQSGMSLDNLLMGSPYLADGSTGYLLVARYDSWDEDAKDFGFWEAIGIFASEWEANRALATLAYKGHQNDGYRWQDSYDTQYRRAEIHRLPVTNTL